ncbi:MAG: 2-amino-4-hydroxy-6-hydroxymethyldihydropteridine diphosphokinase [Cyclobacteriaceae bacterium]|jgi:2-amino-4-hydroxy-6-hydroxymethyldihydropteridine diphosphokinase|nr:2-amino-4-hydroxy-6-hydroxymethyldihydropteridine diphosphokinase [Cytophagales bacterium]MCZ8326597.1 2-amino-4-hydroxy-6-hydroxymethyldihydropteridine diphosphokinase [Cyclobacteriaceae bacterium]
MIFLSLGTNLGDRLKNLRTCLVNLKQEGIELRKVSSVYETAAWGNLHQNAYLNMAVGFHTEKEPTQLLETCQAIEIALGRIRKEKWGPRVIDVDIILFEDRIISSPALQIPHPLFAQRKFVLLPLAEIAADFIEPKSNKSIAELLRQCDDSLEVKLYAPATFL